MTRFETLIACRNHWQWLLITGSHRKQDYVPAQEWPFDCACCFYAGSFFYSDRSVCNDYRGCNNCPLLGYAWNPSNDEYHTPCEDNGSYMMWCNYKFNKDIACKYAQQIVSACNRAIEDLISKGEL